MKDDKHLTFIYEIIKDKFRYKDSVNKCPFCNRGEMSDIIAEEGPIVLLKNKFPALADTYQLVLIETDKCSESITTYGRAHLQKVITMGTDHWLELEKNGGFKSVVFFKNHGPLSGGSLDHAHMQIVGLKDVDYKENLKDGNFDGVEIYKEGNCRINVSTEPVACSTEINIITSPRNDGFIADNLPAVVEYVLKMCSSYNLFFYHWRESIICKVVPRWVTSPYLVGYSIPHSSNRAPRIAEELHSILVEN